MKLRAIYHRGDFRDSHLVLRHNASVGVIEGAVTPKVPYVGQHRVWRSSHAVRGLSAMASGHDGAVNHG